MHAVTAPESSPRFSYASPDQPVLTRAVIRTVEFMGGQRRLRKSYLRGREEMREGADFFDMAIRTLGLQVNFDPVQLAKIPREGPVLFVANHPYGVLDGLTFAWLARKARPEVRVMAHGVLCSLPEAREALLPVDFSGTREAERRTLETRMTAQSMLRAGQAVGIFPAGAVSTSQKPLKGPALDLPWAPFTAKLALSAKATVVPIYFEGQNSRLFQAASHVSSTLRLSLLFRETARRMGSELNVRIGDPIPHSEWGVHASREEIVAEFRRRTFALAEGRAEMLGEASRLQFSKPKKPVEKTEKTLY